MNKNVNITIVAEWTSVRKTTSTNIRAPLSPEHIIPIYYGLGARYCCLHGMEFPETGLSANIVDAISVTGI
jgi:hypothetical protein